MQIVDRDAQTPFGPVDFVALDGDTLVFVFAATRPAGQSVRYGIGGDTVELLRRSAIRWLNLNDHSWRNHDMRAEIISLALNSANAVISAARLPIAF
jgi:Holliday junction resolvase-like predicted endonuclease